jgi:hypothetical protein
MGLLVLLLIVPGLLLVVALVIAVFFRTSEEGRGEAAEEDGPGRYRIAGSSEDGREISTIIEAESWADACRQAEDRGIEVTVVQRLIG